MMAEPKVSVLIIAYMHEKFIAQAIDSVLTQETDFPFEVVIAEDNSPDNTRKIIEGYEQRHPDKVRLLAREQNLGMLRNWVDAYGTCRGKYIAALEGDDYWTSPRKLQMQVDALDTHPDWVICFHNVRCFYEDGSQEPFLKYSSGFREVHTLDDLLDMSGNFIRTCSVMFRSGVVPSFPEWYFSLAMGDWPFNIMLARYGKLGYIDQVMADYRIHAGGAWTSKDELSGMEAILEMFGKIRQILDGDRAGYVTDQMMKRYVELANRALQLGEVSRARSALWGMLRREPAFRRAVPRRELLRTALLIDAPLVLRMISWTRRQVAPVKARRMVGDVLRRAGVLPRRESAWVVAEEQPKTVRVLGAPRLFAILGAWMEADVIAATVTNAFAQGCERVYLVDNDSPDDTVAEAMKAGATLAESFSTDKYDEQLRLDIMNRVVRNVSAAESADHIWWLWLDADEFPHGPRGLTVLEFLSGLDRRFRIVGARFINHFPSAHPAYIPGFHPLDFQPLCEEHRFGCALHHRKHPLQRFDRAGPPIICDRGFHEASSMERPLREPTEAIFLHHFPFRDPIVTRSRLKMLCANDAAGGMRVKDGDDAADGMVPRFQTLEAVYTADWEHVRNYRSDSQFSIARPVAWTSLAAAADYPSKRWYAPEDLDRAKQAYLSQQAEP